MNTDIFKWVNNYKLIKFLGIKVIGCTTTGLSKYRGLLASLQPRTLLIEEAAKTLEANVMAGMLESLEQLILVGDHQQLQASATIQALQQTPYHLNVSMFERLVNNGIPYTMLNTQRRMITDVRKLLCIEPEPFYSGMAFFKLNLAP
jgi:helicase required for RNAi-mediated heterochromatin assembly 1